jgi:hypothetical protein
VDFVFREPLERFLAAADEPVVVRFLLPVRLEDCLVRLPAGFAGPFAAARTGGTAVSVAGEARIGIAKGTSAGEAEVGKVAVTSSGLLHDSSSFSRNFKGPLSIKMAYSRRSIFFLVHKGKPLGSLPSNNSRKARMPPASIAFVHR